MKTNMNCHHCGNEYTYRKGKMYCSSSCKTMAHRDKKNGIVTESSNVVTPERKIFYLSDYEGWDYTEYCSFPIFCFLTKGMLESEPVELLRKVAAAIVDDSNFEKNIEDASHPIGKEYKKFQEHFYANKYQIQKERIQETPSA